ncbi:VOC family protein [Streptomyces sp. NPDC057236]|uniref:VOC family protein n=1 Tax=Streptomyces sp. NPDC057236 TaxID=3346059 RepID=UPI00362933C5
MVEAVVEAAQYGVRVGGGAAQRTQPNTRPLGRPIVGRKGPYIWLQRDEGLGLGFQQTAALKPGKNRMHFDITSPDPAAEQQRVEKLGGCRLEKYASGGFLVMADPEGNEFCIIPEGSYELDEGKANYLNQRKMSST